VLSAILALFTIHFPSVIGETFSCNQTEIIEEQSYLRFNSLTEATTEFEKKFLLYYLKKNKYDLKQVSNQLNLTPVQLRDKLLKFDIGIKL